MLFRFISTCAMLVLLTVPVSGVSLYPLADANLLTAAARLKEGDFKGAREAALRAPQGGAADFVVGMTATKLGLWEEAATRLAIAPEAFPLLADYAFYHQANALHKLKKFAEAQIPLQKLLKNYPDSRLVRPAMLLLGDALYDSGDYKGALALFEQFIEKYPAGTDSLSASYRSALSREQLGDAAGAGAALRTMWLTYPAAPVAEKAAEELQQLSLKGVKFPSYSPQELYRRASTLYDLGKYSLAAKALTAVPLDGVTDDFMVKLRLKTGQAQFKARQYKEAEKTLTGLLARELKKDLADETRYWLAKTLDKNKKDEEAFSAFLLIADASPLSPLADDALLEAAYIRKDEKKWAAELPVLKRCLAAYPDSPLIKSVIWEIAWSSFQERDYTTAAEYFQKLTNQESTKEKALYWSGRALAASGDQKGAQAAFAELLTEFPLGYYALTYTKGANVKEEDISLPIRNLTETLPLPVGQERIKALITLGLYDEAGRELAFQKKPKSLLGFARLYLEMENYAAAISLLKKERLRRPDKDTISLWNTSYPLAYRDHVAKNAAASGLPEGLIYSIIRAESTFSPTALSPVGAIGLMQIMPTTAAAIARDASFESASLTRPGLNIRFGTQHLKDLLNLYKGDLILVIAAYNAGSGNVARWQKSFGTLPKDEFIENIPFAETREYVKKVLAGIEVYQRLYNLRDGTAVKPAPVAAHEVPSG